MAQLSRADLKVLVDKYINKNGNLKNTGINANVLLKHFIDSLFNLTDDVGSGGQVNADWLATSGVSEILNKPSTFPPESHTHAISAISGLQALLDVYNAHLGNTANPHSVTKSQVGLSNVDNTSDLAKPISNATQLALDSKADKFSAANTIKGRISTNGDVQDLTPTEVTALLNVFTSALKGLVPASSGGTINYLRADATWANPLPVATEVGATNTITTTSTTDVLMTSMTLTPGAGTYMIFFSCTGYNNGTPAGFIECSLYVNGSQVATSLRRNTNGGNTNASSLEGVIAFQEKVTVLASQTIEVRWRVNGATGTVIQRKLSLMSCQ